MNPQKQSERFRIMADYASDWEYWIGEDGHYIYMSPSCKIITGYEYDPHEFMDHPESLSESPGITRYAELAMMKVEESDPVHKDL